MIFGPSSTESSSAIFSRGAASVLRESYGPWTDAVRLNNFDAEVVIAPSSGRIVRYALADGGRNMLWEAPRSARSHLRGHTIRQTIGQTIDGENALPWPQYRWPRAIANDPGQQLDSPHDLHVISRCIVELASAPLLEFGARMVREIALSPHGERVTITSRLDPLGLNPRTSPARKSAMKSTMKSAAKSAARFAEKRIAWVPWSIARIPTPTRIAIRIDPSSDLPGGHKLLRHEPWEPVRRIGDDVLLARCQLAHAAKFGCDGDLIAAEIGEQLLILRRLTTENDAGRFLAGEATQVFSSGVTADARAGMDFVSLEFTGAREQRSPSLAVQWDLLSWNPTNTDNELAAFVRTL